MPDILIITDVETLEEIIRDAIAEVIEGFFEEVVQQIPDAAMSAWVRERINGKYVAAQEEGRV